MDDFKLRLLAERANVDGATHTLDEGKVDLVCQLLWTSAEQGLFAADGSGDREFCSVLNFGIINDIETMLRPAVRIARALNKFCVQRRLSRERGETQFFRGCGLPLSQQAIFTPGQEFRMPKFLATSLNLSKAKEFATDPTRVPPGTPSVIWHIKVPSNCVHVNLLVHSLVSGEKEYLFTPCKIPTHMHIEDFDCVK